MTDLKKSETPRIVICKKGKNMGFKSRNGRRRWTKNKAYKAYETKINMDESTIMVYYIETNQGTRDYVDPVEFKKRFRIFV